MFGYKLGTNRLLFWVKQAKTESVRRVLKIETILVPYCFCSETDMPNQNRHRPGPKVSKVDVEISGELRCSNVVEKSCCRQAGAGLCS